nr:tripartite tricarboxylate transporter permease [Pannonibacter phragmitetus]
MLLFGLTGIRLFVKVVELPRGLLIPLILLLSIVGAYAVNNRLGMSTGCWASACWAISCAFTAIPLGPSFSA